MYWLIYWGSFLACLALRVILSQSGGCVYVKLPPAPPPQGIMDTSSLVFSHAQNLWSPCMQCMCVDVAVHNWKV